MCVCQKTVSYSETVGSNRAVVLSPGDVSTGQKGNKSQTHWLVVQRRCSCYALARAIYLRWHSWRRVECVMEGEGESQLH